MTMYAMLKNLYFTARDQLRAAAQPREDLTAALGLETLQTEPLGNCKVIQLSDYPRDQRRRSGQQTDVEGMFYQPTGSRDLMHYPRWRCGFNQKF
jgi:hypothetical protein